MCVRVTDMRGVDLNVFRFDFDLTFAALVMNADGTVYHRFGGRLERMSMKALVRLLRESLEDHREYQNNPKPPEAKPKRALEDTPKYAKLDCIHCHMVNDVERPSIWMYPRPERVGLELEVDEPRLKSGERLLRANGARIRSEADLQWVLNTATSLEIETDRGVRSVPLAKDWQVGTPLDISWRASMWRQRPMPGFGGPKLKPEELKKHGVTWGFTITYIVDWGEDAATGRNAAKAGLKKGDVVVGAGGKSDFEDELHFQAWFRLTQKAGTTIEFEVRRGGKRLTIPMEILP